MQTKGFAWAIACVDFGRLGQKKRDAVYCEGVRFHREVLEWFSPGFYADAKGAQYFCVSEFLLAYNLPTEMDFVRVVLAEVIEEFPEITVIEFAD